MDEDFKADKVLSELLLRSRLVKSNKDQEVLACQAKTNSSRPIKVITRKPKWKSLTSSGIDQQSKRKTKKKTTEEETPAFLRNDKIQVW
ncbi:hypothetical protein AVEN_25087-1 [Araneus ventricosus]|uniref:Uncharacterized protein n=1 Tax=Araneus ventricosus TaxID=182803 RepID=A0A4Y2JEK4_ARAVE|nr:hypothetical protein AVEN_25087-1 [Araneus ventricosus]